MVVDPGKPEIREREALELGRGVVGAQRTVTDVREESVEEVKCRWCGRTDAIEVVARADAPVGDDPAAD